jgi:hypothetical protein
MLVALSALEQIVLQAERCMGRSECCANDVLLRNTPLERERHAEVQRRALPLLTTPSRKAPRRLLPPPRRGTCQTGMAIVALLPASRVIAVDGSACPNSALPTTTCE